MGRERTGAPWRIPSVACRTAPLGAASAFPRSVPCVRAVTRGPRMLAQACEDLGAFIGAARDACAIAWDAGPEPHIACARG